MPIRYQSFQITRRGVTFYVGLVMMDDRAVASTASRYTSRSGALAAARRIRVS